MNPQHFLKRVGESISPVLVACPISDALITQIPVDKEPLCGNAAVYVLMMMMMMMMMMMIVIIIIIVITFKLMVTCITTNDDK